MSNIPLRQRSSTEIVDAAFQVFRREPAQFIVAAALVYVPWLVIALILGVDGETNRTPSGIQAFVAAIGGVFVYALAGGATTVIASDVYLDQPTDLARAFRTVGGRLGSVIVANLVSAMLIGIGMVLLFIPGLYALARFFASTQAVVLENKPATSALSRSLDLSSDLKRHILNTLILVGLLVFAIAIGGRLLISVFPSAILRATLSTAISSVLYPFLGITSTLLYYDTRIRKEGFDVEYMAASGVGATASA